MKPARRLQAIDIGTNSVRAIVVEAPESAPHRIIDDEKEQSRLGQGLDSTGALSPEGVERTIEALRAMLEIGRSLDVTEVRAVATAAVRMASNGDAFVDRLRDELGLSVDVISEDEEGRLVYLSAQANFPIKGRSAVVDIGGGSVEVVLAVGSTVDQIVSLPLGARVLAERFVDGDPISDAAFRRLKKHVRRTLKDAMGAPVVGVQTLIGSGGTVTSLAAMVAASREQRHESLHGLEMQRPEVMRILADLSRSTAGARRKMPGLAPERADIILPGAIVIAEVMKLLGVSCIAVNARGIREGIVVDTIRRLDASSVAFDRLDAVREFGERCRFDRLHAEQVSRLSLSLFDQLAGELGFEPAQRPLLEAAALLHDVGYYIAYDRHHRHSYHLIANSNLPGYTSRELRMIAAIARYHTKALPKSRHEAVSGLTRDERAVVESLAAVLRLADGLDRARGCHVRSVSATRLSEGLRVVAHGDGDMHAEMFAAGKKKDMFEKVFSMPVRIAVDSDAPDSLAATDALAKQAPTGKVAT